MTVIHDRTFGNRGTLWSGMAYLYQSAYSTNEATLVWRQLLFPVTTIKSAAPYTAAGSSAARVFDFAPAALAR